MIIKYFYNIQLKRFWNYIYFEINFESKIEL